MQLLMAITVTLRAVIQVLLRLAITVTLRGVIQVLLRLAITVTLRGVIQFWLRLDKQSFFGRSTSSRPSSYSSFMAAGHNCHPLDVQNEYAEQLFKFSCDCHSSHSLDVQHEYAEQLIKGGGCSLSSGGDSDLPWVLFPWLSVHLHGGVASQ